MDDTDLTKYVLEQAKIEVEHTRSWPTKILAFYVAINFGLVASLLSLSARPDKPIEVPRCGKALITAGIFVVLSWVIALLAKNHRSYLAHRNIQIRFQKKHLDGCRDVMSLPDDWFKENKVSLCTRAMGWGFYACLVLFITVLTLAGLWAGA